MKKYLETLAALGLVLALAGCGQTAANGKAPVSVSAENSVAQILESASYANGSASDGDAAETERTAPGKSTYDAEQNASDEAGWDIFDPYTAIKDIHDFEEFYGNGMLDANVTLTEDGWVVVESASAQDGIDVDLTRMSGTMVYAQVSDMMCLPENYMGKIVRMRGQSYSSYYEETDTTYYYILIADAAACCAQGLEYVLADGVEYPAEEAEATVTGVFEMYDELGITYCRLNNATLSAGV